MLGNQIIIGDPAYPGHFHAHAVIQPTKAGQAAHYGLLTAVADGIDVGNILGGDVERDLGRIQSTKTDIEQRHQSIFLILAEFRG
ncbi:hypothetical protein D3C79_506780 [compost metagenome]